MAARKFPDDEDWMRRYLRKRCIECEGEALQTALGAMNAEQWKNMRAAWRQHRHRILGPWPMALGTVHNKKQWLGPIWRRLVSWAVISEEHAKYLASKGLGPGFPAYADSGARIVLSVALSNLVNVEKAEEERAPKRRQRQRGVAAAVLKLEAKEREIDDSLDDRIIKRMEEFHFSREESLELLDELKTMGHYERIISEVESGTPSNEESSEWWRIGQTEEA